MSSLRLGLVGAGWIARDHVAVLTKFEGIELAAVCDLQRDRAERLAPRGARVYERWEDLLDREQLDALWVCTPPLAHREPAVAALEHGVHVFLEKPIARAREDAEAIVATAERTGLVCAVGYQWHATQVLRSCSAGASGRPAAGPGSFPGRTGAATSSSAGAIRSIS